MPKKPNPGPARQPIRGQGWKRATSIDREKYDTISGAILSTLKQDPSRFAEVAEGVRAKVPQFEGSVSWYTITCLRELETQGKVTRHATRPVGYSKP